MDLPSDGIRVSNHLALDRRRVKLQPLASRDNKVKKEEFARHWEPGEISSGLTTFLDSLPRIFKGNDLRQLVTWLGEAAANKKAVFVGMGAHVIKTGLNPLLIRLMEEDLIAGIAVHGASAVHDTELALIGETSEDVASGLVDGTFGMVRETGETIFRALRDFSPPADGGPSATGGEDLPAWGFGYRLGKYIEENKLPHREVSLFAAAYRLGKPLTVHVGLGTDIIHQHPEADGKLIGETSFADFEILTRNLAAMDSGGGFLNFGSAVIIPEVFLKALTISRNVTGGPYNFFTANFDQFDHYRPRFNIIARPTRESGYRGFHFAGHHEIMLPLLMQLWREAAGRS